MDYNLKDILDRLNRGENPTPADDSSRDGFIEHGGILNSGRMKERDFFISYSHEDEQTASWIADTLEECGYTVFIQARDIMPGDNFLSRMDDFLKNSRSFIAVWSKSYAESIFCMEEFRAAYMYKYKHRLSRFIPVCIEDYPMKPLYAALVRVDLYGIPEGEGKRRLLKAVGYPQTSRQSVEEGLPERTAPHKKRNRIRVVTLISLLAFVLMFSIACGIAFMIKRST